MRSKTTKQILSETPESLRQEVREYGNKVTTMITFPENKDGLGDSSRNLEEQEGFDGFIVTIDDGFVAYEYRFPDGYNLSINDIAKAIETGCGLKVQSHKLIE